MALQAFTAALRYPSADVKKAFQKEIFVLNWLANQLATRITRVSDAKVEAAVKALDAQREASRRETRALISEMEDMLEKFSRVVARQAMRRSRAMKATLEEEEQEQQPAAQQAAQVDESHLSPAQRKALIRARMAAQGRMAHQ